MNHTSPHLLSIYLSSDTMQRNEDSAGESSSEVILFPQKLVAEALGIGLM
jgi:hypothetical protein